MKTRIVVGCLVLAGWVLAACGGSNKSGCPNCAKLVACCQAEADAGAPTGGRCVNNPGEVTSTNAENSSCESDPSLIQGDADSTCAGYVTAEAALPNSPSACH